MDENVLRAAASELLLRAVADLPVRQRQVTVPRYSKPISITAKLVSLDLSRADESKCPADSSPLLLVKRNIVYCFGEASRGLRRRPA